jgi:hypothetical protein
VQTGTPTNTNMSENTNRNFLELSSNSTDEVQITEEKMGVIHYKTYS